jgi:toxin-antitoxin system PIN domain toxin
VKLVDANVLLYGVNERSAHHRVARDWLDSALNGRETVGFAWIVLLAFVRLSTHPAVFPRPLAPADAIAVVSEWLARPTAVIIEPTPRHLEQLGEFQSGVGTAGNLVNDAHLAALAREHGAEIASFDADFARFHGVRWQQPGAP